MPQSTFNESSETKFQIDGFRSLKEFEIKLGPGLNVLVGPNGSGKTNFIDFLDFIAECVTSGAVNAVSNAGGVARVFGQEKSRKSSLSINAQVNGFAEMPDNVVQGNLFHRFKFQYEVEVRFHKPTSTLYISREWIKFFKLCSHHDGEAHHNTTVGVMSITRSSGADDIPPVWHVGQRLLAKNARNPLALRRRFQPGKPLAQMMSDGDAPELMPDESIMSGTVNFPAFQAIRSTISRGRSFNVFPEKVRNPDDITRPPGIARDGSGLASTLYHLQAMKKSTTNRNKYRLRLASKDTLDEVIEWTRLVFQDLDDLSVTQDAHSGKYIGYITVGSDVTLKLPFQSASDGTLKWLSLVTFMLTSGGDITIEEPENFLHPKMQQFLIELIRDSLPENRRAAHAVISTHSETLINQCDAEELIIFSFTKNRTTCSRVKNPDRVREEINRTGFGLGYFYANNAIS